MGARFSWPFNVRGDTLGAGSQPGNTRCQFTLGTWGWVLALALVVLIFRAGAPHPGDGEWSVFAYGGQWSANHIGAILRGRTEFRDSYVGVGGGSRTLYRFREKLSLELEANAGTHGGLQHHSEVNTALLLRWERFPWDRYVNTSVALGLGPSYAFRDPEVEQHPRRPTSRLLVFMPVEITFAQPRARKPQWEWMVRIHHRSGAFGLVSDARGSNFVSTGARYRLSDQDQRGRTKTSH